VEGEDAGIGSVVGGYGDGEKRDERDEMVDKQPEKKK
jgi:hypothetical protein